MKETENKEAIKSDNIRQVSDTENLENIAQDDTDTENSNLTEEIEDKKQTKKAGFSQFLKKYGFYLGLGLLVIILAVVLIFDGNRRLRGDIPYDDSIYVVGDNSISMIRYNQEPVRITSQLFRNYEDQKLGLEAHNGILMSKDGKSIMYVDDLYLLSSEDFQLTKLVGTLWMYDGVKNIKIADDADFYYVVNDDFNIVLYKTYRLAEDQSRLISNLYKFDLATEQSVVLREDMDSDLYSVSKDGKVCVFLDDKQESFVENGEPTYSLFIYEDGQTKKLADSVYDLEASVYTGTADVNYPIINKNGDKIVYAVVDYIYMVDDEQEQSEDTEEEEKKVVYPTFNMYLYHNGVSKLIAKSCAQLLISRDFSQMIYIDAVVDHLARYDEIGFCGTYNHYDVETGKSTKIMDNVFGFVERNVLGFVDNDFIDANFYFKKYDIVMNTAYLYTMKNGKEILIDKYASVGTDEDLNDMKLVFFSPDYKDVYVFKEYVSKTSSLLHRFTIKSNGSISDYMCEEMQVITSVKLSKNGDFLVYNADGKLIIISDKNIKKTIELNGVSSFSITEDGKYVYYYKETEIGLGAVYYYDLYNSEKPVKFLNNVNEVWNYKDNKVMLRINTDYNTMTGDLYLSDFEQFEYVSGEVYAQITSRVTER